MRRTSPIDGFPARIPHDDPCFPLAVHHIKPLGVDYGYLHRHPEFEICYFPTDAGTFLIQDREYPIRCGDVFIVNANDIHQPILKKRANNGAIVVYFSSRVFGDADESADWLSPFIFAGRMRENRVGASRQMRTLIAQLHRTWQRRPPHWQLAARGILTHILSLIACDFLTRYNTADSPINMRQAHRFSSVIEYINENLHTRIAASRLYALAGLSHSQFSAKFASTFGIGLLAYVQFQRVSRARRLLKSTSLSVMNIAMRTGFSSSSFFSTVFRKQTGMTPTQYRRA